MYAFGYTRAIHGIQLCTHTSCIERRRCDVSVVHAGVFKAKMVKVTLRLDDGSIVMFADDGVASRVAVNKAIQANKLGEKDCVRLEQFIATARSMAPKGSMVELSAPSMVRFYLYGIPSCSFLVLTFISPQGGDAKRARVGPGDGFRGERRAELSSAGEGESQVKG